jgi:hypothetical protein
MSKNHEKEFEAIFLERFYMDGKDMRYHETLVGGVLRFGNRKKIKEGSIAGHADRLGYLKVVVCGVEFCVHRIAFFLYHGYWPIEVDHINRDKADNRKDNLREASRLTNCRNKSMMKNNTSGINGVSWDAESGKWKANIRVNKRLINLGRYANICDAESVRVDAEKRYGFYPNHGRRNAV